MTGASTCTPSISRAWVSSLAMLALAATHFPGCQAIQQASSLQETFKAVILKPRPLPQRFSLTNTATATTSTVTAATAAGTEADSLVPADCAVVCSSDDRAAEDLAADLIRSLSELVVGKQAVAARAEKEGEAEAAAAWSSMWEALTGVPLEDYSAGGADREGGAVAAVAATAKERVPVRKPCDSHSSAATGNVSGERLSSKARTLRGGLGGEGEAARGAGIAAETRRLFVEEVGVQAETEDVSAGAGAERGAIELDECLGTTGEEDFLKIESTWANVVLTGICVVCAGLAAGLTMGLLSIEPLEMAIKQRSGTPTEQLQASRILPLVSRHHFLLVTLLLFNSLANEALPIFLGNLVPSWLAVILSVSLVLFFGEIFPSAVFTGKNQLAIASGMAWLVYLLMAVLGPVAWPIAWMLDRILGIEGYKRYNRAEIAALVEVQQELSTEDATHKPLHADEVSIVNGVLLTAERSVSEAMITMDKVFCLGIDERLSASTMADIMAAGYSRVLVYEGEDTRNIRGYLQVKKMIILNPDDERLISSLVLRIPVVVSPNKSLLELLNTFQTGKSHLALVSASPAITLESLKHGVRLEGAARPMGIITLEDIIEEIIQEEIMDESDRLTQFIEDRAKDTLLRFAVKRQERLSNRRITPLVSSMIGRGTPSMAEETNSLLRRLGTGSTGSPTSGSKEDSIAPPSPSYQSIGDASSFASALATRIPGGRPPSPPAAPGVDERAALLAKSRSSSGSSRRRLSEAKATKRPSATVGQAMIAAAERAREHSGSGNEMASSPSNLSAAAAAAGSRRRSAVRKPSSLFRMSSGDGSSVNSIADATISGLERGSSSHDSDGDVRP